MHYLQKGVRLAKKSLNQNSACKRSVMIRSRVLRVHVLVKDVSLFFSPFYFPASGRAVVTGVVPSSPEFLLSIFYAHRLQQSHCSSIFHRMFVANSRSRVFRKSICAPEKFHTNLHTYALGGARTHELTCTRLEDNLMYVL